MPMTGTNNDEAAKAGGAPTAEDFVAQGISTRQTRAQANASVPEER